MKAENESHSSNDIVLEVSDPEGVLNNPVPPSSWLIRCRRVLRLLIIPSIFIALAGISNSVMDTLTFHYSSSIFSSSGCDPNFWNPDESWKNKYK